MRIEVFGKTWTLTCKTHVKVTFFIKIWNDPMVIPVILPQAVSRKTPLKVQFLTKVLKRIFPKVWGSIWGLYSRIWRNSCGNFDYNLIRTRLAWSQDPENPKNHEFIIVFLKFWRSAAEAPACKFAAQAACTLLKAIVLCRIWTHFWYKPMTTHLPPTSSKRNPRWDPKLHQNKKTRITEPE